MASSGSETRALKHFVADSLQAYASTILNGTRWTTLKTYAQRPKIQTLGTTALINVTNVRRRTIRIGMGRPAGLKRHEYEVGMVILATDHDEQAGADEFDQLTDQVDIALELLALEATISDPLSSQQYRVTKLGEEITSNTQDPTMTAAQGEVTFQCDKTFTVWVHYND